MYGEALAITFTDGWAHLAWYMGQFPGLRGLRLLDNSFSVIEELR